MKKKNWRIIATLITNPINTGYTYLHGIVYGLDYPDNDLQIHTDTDLTTYHALVYKKREQLGCNIALKDIIAGENTKCIVERFKTTEPDEAIEFFYRYNHKPENEDK